MLDPFRDGDGRDRALRVSLPETMRRETSRLALAPGQPLVHSLTDEESVAETRGGSGRIPLGTLD
jgi:hypothetical protein